MANKTWASAARLAVIEFVVIVTGVLVALGVDEWRQTQRDQALELEYAERLKTDLQRDTARFGDFERVALTVKASILRQMVENTEDVVPPDGVSLLEALRYSTFIALPEAQNRVFREMESTGTLSLIQNPSIRTELSNHYALYDLIRSIYDEPMGGYREMVASTIPSVWFQELAPSNPEELQDAVRSLRARPGFQAAVNAELSYTGAMITYLEQAKNRTERLLETLSREYPD